MIAYIVLLSTAVLLTGLLLGIRSIHHREPGLLSLFLLSSCFVLFVRSITILVTQNSGVQSLVVDPLLEMLNLLIAVALLYTLLLINGASSPKQRTDITEQSERQRELLRATLESTADGIFVVDNSGNHILSNTRFVDLWRIPRALMIEGVDLYSHDYVLNQLEDPLEFQAFVGALKESSRAEIFDLQFLDGRLLECYTVPLVERKRNFGRVWSFRDITKLKRTEETAMLYLDLMSHDIRNRLQGIAMSIEILNMLTEDPGSTGTLIDIEENIQRCASLISKVKASERIDEAPFLKRSLTNAIDDSLNAIRGRFDGVQIDYMNHNQEAIVRSDRFLETLLINILENAVVHNQCDEKHVWVSLRKLDQGFEVSIADNGPGMSDELKADLFDKNRRYGGVGLHLVSHISEKYGGNLQVADRVPGSPEEGLEFRVWIPESEME